VIKGEARGFAGGKGETVESMPIMKGGGGGDATRKSTTAVSNCFF